MKGQLSAEIKRELPAEAYIFLVCVALLTSIGLVMTFSASFPFAVQEYSTPARLFLKQLVSLSLALTAAFISYRFTRRFHLGRAWFAFWALSTFFVLLTFVPGVAEEAKGAARWIDLKFFGFQPSEILKIAVIISVAHLSMQYYEKREKIYLYTAFAIVLISSLLVVLQKDLTTAVIIYLAGCLCLLFAPIKLKELRFLFLVAALGFVAAVKIEPYRIKRLLIFMDPYRDIDAGRQVIVSLLALAKGGITGLGIGKSIFKYNVLPEAHTDFIFSIIGSELGLFGSLMVVFLLLAAFFAGFRLSFKIKDEFGRITALSLVTMIAIQSIINIGGTLKALPPTGVPLPFVSFGGTSLVVSYTVVGIICGLCAKGARNVKGARSWRRN